MYILINTCNIPIANNITRKGIAVGEDDYSLSQTKEVGTMAANTKNYVYEVDKKNVQTVLKSPGVSKHFIEECKRIAEKYRKK